MPHPFHEIVRSRTSDLDRLVGFTDGVFAVAITILALQFDISDDLDTAGSFFSALRDELSAIPIYILSFALIGLYWVLHHRIFNFIERQDAGLVWLNLAFLAAVCFIPFPTTVLGDYAGGRWLNVDGGDVATSSVIFYSATMALVSTLLSGMWFYASHRHRLIDPDLDPALVRYFRLRALPTPILFLTAIPIALWNPTVAMYSWLLMPLGFVLVRRSVSTSVRDEEEETDG